MHERKPMQDGPPVEMAPGIFFIPYTMGVYHQFKYRGFSSNDFAPSFEEQEQVKRFLKGLEK